MIPASEQRMKLHWKTEWTLILVLFLFFRVLYFLIGVLQASHPDPEPLSTGPVYDAAATLLKLDAFSHALVNIWFRWDAIWYLKIAAFGYSPQDGTFAFMPLYPWLVRGFSALIGDYLLAALLISNLACLAALLLFYEVALGEIHNQEAAMWGTIFITFFPTSFFLFAAYTDSLFLALVLASWLFARRANWLPAGLLASLATLCRLQGTLMSIVLLWMFFTHRGFSNGLLEIIKHKGHEVRRGTPGGTIKNLFAPLRAIGILRVKDLSWLANLLPAVTFAAYTLWLRFSGIGSIPATLETFWNIHTVAPWTGFGLFLQRLFVEPRVFVDYIDLSLLLVILALIAMGLFRLVPPLSLYNLLTLGLFFMRGTPPHLLDSFSRYFLSLFPAFIIMARLSTININSPRSRIFRLAFLMVSIGLQIFLVIGFLDWRWIA